MSETTIFSKQELIEALRFEYGNTGVDETFFKDAKGTLASLQNDLVLYESLRDNAPSTNDYNHYTLQIIRTRRRLLLWKMVRDYLESEAKL